MTAPTNKPELQSAPRSGRNLPKAEAQGSMSILVRLAIDDLWPSGIPPFLHKQRRDAMIQNWALERGQIEPSRRTIHRFLNERD